VLLTGSLGILVRPLCDYLSLPFSRIYATELEINGDSFSGCIKGAHYFGEEKNNLVKYLTNDLVPVLAGSFCYADSVSDLPMMHGFGHPIAVNPDKALESAARENNWEIIYLRNKITRQAQQYPTVETKTP
jgi:phosphoserine phosphatase